MVEIGMNNMKDGYPQHYVQKGLATQVERIFPPEKNRRGLMRGIRSACDLLDPEYGKVIS